MFSTETGAVFFWSFGLLWDGAGVLLERHTRIKEQTKTEKLLKELYART